MCRRGSRWVASSAAAAPCGQAIPRDDQQVSTSGSVDQRIPKLIKSAKYVYACFSNPCHPGVWCTYTISDVDVYHTVWGLQYLALTSDFQVPTGFPKRKERPNKYLSLSSTHLAYVPATLARARARTKTAPLGLHMLTRAEPVDEHHCAQEM